MKYFTIKELTNSSTAKSKGIDNTPNEIEVERLTDLINNVLDPIREKFGSPIRINSGFRGKALNAIVGGVPSSHHVKGMAADIDSTDNKKLWALTKEMVQTGKIKVTQLIHEKGTPGNPDWIHVGYDPSNLKNQILTIK